MFLKHFERAQAGRTTRQGRQRHAIEIGERLATKRIATLLASLGIGHRNLELNLNQNQNHWGVNSEWQKIHKKPSRERAVLSGRQRFDYKPAKSWVVASCGWGEKLQKAGYANVYLCVCVCLCRRERLQYQCSRCECQKQNKKEAQNVPVCVAGNRIYALSSSLSVDVFRRVRCICERLRLRLQAFFCRQRLRLWKPGLWDWLTAQPAGYLYLYRIATPLASIADAQTTMRKYCNHKSGTFYTNG